MKLPDAVAGILARFEGMSIRERMLVAGASLAAIVMIWMVAFLDPMTAKQQAFDIELVSLQKSISDATQAMTSDPVLLAQQQEDKLKRELAAVNAQLASTSAGLIPPERMVQVIRDVLARQPGVTLISLHNAPVTTLVLPTPDTAASSAGPYVHPIEIVVEGSYLDVLAYLHALENLEWRFYWRLLELKSTEYPVNRVRIELSTLSLDKDWIGV
jgi:MSHA biogenesis protein MshJ